MGGDGVNSPASVSGEDESSLEHSPLLEADETYHRRPRAMYSQIFHSYNTPTRNLEDAKAMILGYKPGAWIEMVAGTNIHDYDVPKTTSLIVIGPRGSGKSSLINKISNVFDNDKFAPERAQVSYNPSAGDGTYFLQEHMIPKGSTSFCLYDTRSLSDDPSENMKMLKRWMMKGVKHGELVTRDADDSSLKDRMKNKARQNNHLSHKTRKVNFVIFVVNGLSVLESMRSDDEDKAQYTKALAEIFNCPYLSFKDDKPAVVVTHGDLLSVYDRAHIRVYLGEVFGIPPTKQIFDIPDCCNPITELAVIDLLRYSLERADRNLPYKNCVEEKVCWVPLLRLIFLIIVMLICIIGVLFHDGKQHMPRPEARVKWHKIRHVCYKPGAWTSTEISDYDVPKTTSLPVVGPRGSGKSSLTNKISKAHMIPKESTSFCLYDTRSLSDDPSENIKMEGVKHGELVIRDSDGSSLRNRMKNKARQNSHLSHETRKVNLSSMGLNP